MARLARTADIVMADSVEYSKENCFRREHEVGALARAGWEQIYFRKVLPVEGLVSGCRSWALSAAAGMHAEGAAARMQAEGRAQRSLASGSQEGSRKTPRAGNTFWGGACGHFFRAKQAAIRADLGEHAGAKVSAGAVSKAAGAQRKALSAEEKEQWRQRVVGEIGACQERAPENSNALVLFRCGVGGPALIC
jgi:hypothetical protein